MDDILPAIAERLRAELAPPAKRYRPLVVDGVAVGCLDDERASRIARFTDVFVAHARCIQFTPSLCTAPMRSDAMRRVARELERERLLTAWRDERYAVVPQFGAPALFLLERAAARYFGIRTHAAHANGYVRRRDGSLALWFARRSPKKAIDPDRLDNLVGGGIAAEGASARGADPVRATLIKEAWEEAGIPAEIARNARSAGRLTICREQPDGLQRETVFVHDLELPGDFEPCNQDGEAVEHRCVTLDAAARLIANASGPDVVTVDASLVVLDFLLRRAIAADAPLRAALQSLLRASLDL